MCAGHGVRSPTSSKVQEAGPSHGLGRGVRPLRSLGGAGRLLGVLGTRALSGLRPLLKTLTAWGSPNFETFEISWSEMQTIISDLGPRCKETGEYFQAIQWQTRRVTNRPSEDPGPCRRCTAALSCSADAPTCITLGTHAKSGPRLRRSPQRAVPCGRRNRASLSPTDAPEPTAWRRGSARPHHRLQGWNRVASPRRDGHIPAGFRRPSDGNTKRHESSIR